MVVDMPDVPANLLNNPNELVQALTWFIVLLLGMVFALGRYILRQDASNEREREEVQKAIAEIAASINKRNELEAARRGLAE